MARREARTVDTTDAARVPTTLRLGEPCFLNLPHGQVEVHDYGLVKLLPSDMGVFALHDGRVDHARLSPARLLRRRRC